MRSVLAALSVSRSDFGATPTSSDLAARVYEWRINRGWSQAELAIRGGFARSTLSKIERDQLSPTFELLVKLAQGFGVSVTELLAPGEQRVPRGRLDIDRGEARGAMTYPNHILKPLASDLKGKKFETFLVTFTCRDIAKFGQWNSHRTEDFLFVVSGTLEVHTEGYETFRLEQGQSARFDGQMRHACLAVGEEDCVCLYVCAPLGAAGA